MNEPLERPPPVKQGWGEDAGGAGPAEAEAPPPQPVARTKPKKRASKRSSKIAPIPGNFEKENQPLACVTQTKSVNVAYGVCVGRSVCRAQRFLANVIGSRSVRARFMFVRGVLTAARRFFLCVLAYVRVCETLPYQTHQSDRRCA